MYTIFVKGAVCPVTIFHFKKAVYYERKGKPNCVLLEQAQLVNSGEIKSGHLINTLKQILRRQFRQGVVVLVKLYHDSFCTVFLFYKYLCPRLKFGVVSYGKIRHVGPFS